jgi:type I restriction enzyme S subunit
MSSEWMTTSLGTVTKWASGGTPKKDEPSYWDGDIPWISANSMHTNRFSESDLMITETGLKNGSRLALKDTVLLLVRGSALHSRTPVGIALRDVAFNQDVKAITAKSDAIRPWYLLYWLMGNEQFLLDTVVEYTGIGAGKLDTKRMQGLDLFLPPLREQDEILQIVKSIDDRITLLRETNATLEAIAQALFKSWFVDFDPVRAKLEGRAPEGMDEATARLFPDSFEESELGLVPRGWRVSVLGDVAQTNRKQLQPSDLHAGLHYVGLEHIPRQSLSLTDWGTADGLESAKAAFSAGDILFGKLRPYFHKVVVAPFDGVCSTDILVCQAKLPCYYAFVSMQLFSVALIDYADRLSNGAKMPRVGWKDLAAYPVVIPTESVAMEYMKVVEPLLARMKANVHEAQTLATLRDTLLPRLISGQLRLPEAQGAAEEALA